MIKINNETIKKIDKDSLDKITLLVTKINNITEHKSFKYTNEYNIQNIDFVTNCTLCDLYWFNDFYSIIDIKCPQNIIDRSIKFCKKYKAKFLFAICGIYGVTIYIKKQNKVKDFNNNKWYRRFNKYFWKKYKIVWTIIEV